MILSDDKDEAVSQTLFTSAATRWRDQLLQWTAPPPEVSDRPPQVDTKPGTSTDGWRVHADRFRTLNQIVRGREEPLIRFLSPWLGPQVSVLDVGAGGGRFALPLAERVGQLTAVEPSEGMRTVLAEAMTERGLNVDLVPLRWPDAVDNVPTADLVICANVAYDVAELAPFVAALDRVARRRVAFFMTLSHPVGHIAQLWRQFRGWQVPTGPHYLDAAAVVYDLGIRPNITLVPVEPTMIFTDWDTAVAGYRNRLGLLPNAERDAALRTALAEMIDERDGRLVVRPRESQSAIIWWEK